MDAREETEDWVQHIQATADDASALDWLMKDADRVLYSAGTTKPAESDRDPIAHAVANLTPLLATLDATARNGVAGFTFLSSGGTVYGPSAPVPTHEDTPLWPINSYGIMKVAAEQYVAQRAHAHGFGADILRCANIYGPGEPSTGSQGLIGVARQHLLSAEPVTIYGDGGARRDFLHVDDLCDVLLRLAETPDGVRILNVGSGRSTSVMEIVTALATALGVSPTFERLPTRESDVPVAELDIRRLRSIIDFAPRDTADWLANSAHHADD
jgi:UDP-glucose 4-epimerase